jgi:acyl CoA:acetate/3-ketoacid CoA transferase beta subunit
MHGNARQLENAGQDGAGVGGAMDFISRAKRVIVVEVLA